MHLCMQSKHVASEARERERGHLGSLRPAKRLYVRPSEREKTRTHALSIFSPSSFSPSQERERERRRLKSVSFLEPVDLLALKKKKLFLLSFADE